METGVLTAYTSNKTSPENSSKLVQCLFNNQLGFTEVDLDNESDAELRNRVTQISGTPILPLLFVGTKFIGTWEFVDALDQTGQLFDILFAAGYVDPYKGLSTPTASEPPNEEPIFDITKYSTAPLTYSNNATENNINNTIEKKTSMNDFKANLWQKEMQQAIEDIVGDLDAVVLDRVPSQLSEDAGVWVQLELEKARNHFVDETMKRLNELQIMISDDKNATREKIKKYKLEREHIRMTKREELLDSIKNKDVQDTTLIIQKEDEWEIEDQDAMESIKEASRIRSQKLEEEATQHRQLIQNFDRQWIKNYYRQREGKSEVDISKKVAVRKLEKACQNLMQAYLDARTNELASNEALRNMANERDNAKQELQLFKNFYDKSEMDKEYTNTQLTIPDPHYSPVKSTSPSQMREKVRTTGDMQAKLTYLLLNVQSYSALVKFQAMVRGVLTRSKLKRGQYPGITAALVEATQNKIKALKEAIQLRNALQATLEQSPVKKPITGPWLAGVPNPVPLSPDPDENTITLISTMTKSPPHTLPPIPDERLTVSKHKKAMGPAPRTTQLLSVPNYQPPSALTLSETALMSSPVTLDKSSKVPLNVVKNGNSVTTSIMGRPAVTVKLANNPEPNITNATFTAHLTFPPLKNKHPIPMASPPKPPPSPNIKLPPKAAPRSSSADYSYSVSVPPQVMFSNSKLPRGPNPRRKLQPLYEGPEYQLAAT